MKKIAIISAMAAVTVGMTSCDSFLEDNRLPLSTQIENPTYWDSEANVIKQTDALYTNFTGYGSSTNGLFYFQTLTDNQGSGIGGAFTNWAFTNVPAKSTLWSDPYYVIRQCNYIINNVPNATLDAANPVTNSTKKDKYVGIARMIRGLKYYQLVRSYGDVPYISVVLNTNDTGTGENQLYSARTDRDKVMDNVYEDLKFAAEKIGAGSKTTYSSDLANAIMSEICLYEGTYCKYRTETENYKAADPVRAKLYLERAAAAAKAIIDKSYSLNDSYIANYNSVSLENNPEMIFYKEYKQATLTHQTIQYTCRTTTIAGLSKDAFDSYLLKDGLPASVSGDAAHEALKRDYGYITKGIVAGTGDKTSEGFILSIDNVLANRDQRLAQTIDPVIGYGTTDNGMTWARQGSDQLSSSTGYLIRKFDNPSIPWTYRQGNNYTCAPVYWLALIYCNYAEARAELGVLSDDDLNLTINKLFDRAELPRRTVAELEAINDPLNDANVSSTIWEIRRCRRCETMLDADLRYWDLQRWHMLDRLDTTKYPNIRLGANLGEVAPYNYTDDKGEAKTFTLPTFANMSGNYMQAIPGNDRIFSAREYLYPIPSDQITLTVAPGADKSSLEQNALWK